MFGFHVKSQVTKERAVERPSGMAGYARRLTASLIIIGLMIGGGAVVAAAHEFDAPEMVIGEIDPLAELEALAENGEENGEENEAEDITPDLKIPGPRPWIQRGRPEAPRPDEDRGKGPVVRCGKFLEKKLDLDRETVKRLHDEGYRLPDIIVAAALAKVSDQELTDILAMKTEGKTWREIVSELGLERKDIAKAVRLIQQARRLCSPGGPGRGPGHGPGPRRDHPPMVEPGVDDDGTPPDGEEERPWIRPVRKVIDHLIAKIFAELSGQEPAELITLRESGKSWVEIGRHLGFGTSGEQIQPAE